MTTRDDSSAAVEVEGVSPKTEARYSKFLAAAGLILAPLLVVVSVVLMSYAVLFLGVDDASIGARLALSAGSFLLATVLFLLLTGRLRKVRWREFLKLQNFSWKYPLLGFALALLLYATAGIIGAIAILIGESSGADMGENSTSSELGQLDGGGIVIVGLLLVAVIVPIIEELFFRGAMLSALVQKTSNRWVKVLAVTIVSIVFAFAHTQSNFTSVADWLAVIVPGTVGLTAAILTLKCNSIYPAIFTHLFYNAIVVTSVAIISR